MDDIRQSILSLDSSLKILSTYYDSTSIELKELNEQINNFEKRWTQLIDDLEQCSTRVNVQIFFFFKLIKYFFSVKKIYRKFGSQW
jgi:hypothetical protein